MENFIQLKDSNYTIKISLERMELENVSNLLEQIKVDAWNWYNFWAGDKLWYCDGSECVTCTEADHGRKILVFE